MSRTYRRHPKEFEPIRHSYQPKPRRKQEPLKELRVSEQEPLPTFKPMVQLELLL